MGVEVSAGVPVLMSALQIGHFMKIVVDELELGGGWWGCSRSSSFFFYLARRTGGFLVLLEALLVEAVSTAEKLDRLAVRVEGFLVWLV